MFSPSNGQMLGLLSVIINALKEFVSSIGGSFFKAIYDIVMWAYYYVCRSIYSAFLLPIARVIDICQLIFRKFAGIDQMKIENLNRSQIFGGSFQSDDIVANLISSSIVQRIFFAMLILAVILIVVTTFVANIKSEFNAQDKGGNNKTKIFKNAFRGLLNFVAVPVISLFAIFLSNGLLQAIAGATQVNGDDVYLSGQLFVASAYNANRARASEDNSPGKGNGYYRPQSFGALITANPNGSNNDNYKQGIQDGGGYANFGIFLDDEGDYGLRAADKIDNAFAKGLSITLTDSSNATKLYYGDKLDFWFAGGVLDVIGNVVSMVASAGGTMPGGFTAFPEGYKGGWAASDFNQSEGIYELDYVNNKADEADSGHISFSIYDTALVFYYYDLSLDSFGYVTYIIAGAYFCYALLVTVVGLIKRLFMVTTLFIISPPVCALYPIDEGKALERWRKAFISEVTSAYAVVVVMNIFLSLLPLFASIQVFNYTTISPRMFQLFPMYTWWVDPNTYSVDAGSLFVQNVFMSPVVDALNAFAKLLIMIGGMHFFSKAVKAIAEILGTGNAMQDGAEVAGKLAKTIGGATTLAVAGFTARRGSKKGGETENNSPVSNSGAGTDTSIAPKPENSMAGGGGSTVPGSTAGGGSPSQTGGGTAGGGTGGSTGPSGPSGGGSNGLVGSSNGGSVGGGSTGPSVGGAGGSTTGTGYNAPRRRNAWQRFNKFTGLASTIFKVATGKSGAQDTAGAINKWSDSANHMDFTSTEKVLQSKHERSYDDQVDSTNDSLRNELGWKTIINDKIKEIKDLKEKMKRLSKKLASEKDPKKIAEINEQIAELRENLKKAQTRLAEARKHVHS